MSYGESIRNALASEMRVDERVYIFGQDTAGYGGVFGITQTLLEEFGNTRVRNTPLSESAIVGEAIGAALAGLRPVPEIQFSDFMTTAFSQIIDAAANYHYRFNTSLPFTLRAPHGGGMRIGNFHSKCPEAYYFHTPGLKIVCPSTPYEAKGLLIAAIRDPDPVIYFEEKKLYWEIKGEVPEEAYVLPLGKADIKREGKDITITDPTMTRFLMSLDESVDLVLYAYEHGQSGDTFIQKAPACTILDLAKALQHIFNATNKIIIIGSRHGEKKYETLVNREEMAKAEDLGKYYRIPADTRDLNYKKYFSQGNENISEIDDYTSHNTIRLSVDQVVEKLLKLDYIQYKL